MTKKGGGWAAADIGTFEAAIRFVLWAQSLRTPLTKDLIRDRFGVSRPTAYRWLSLYRAAKGEP